MPRTLDLERTRGRTVRVMQAIRHDHFGPPDVLELVDLPDVHAGPDQVRIAVGAAGVHLLDTSIRAGRAGGPFPLPTLPMIPGREVAGVVDEGGDGVDRSAIGQRVVAHLGQASGGYATQALAPLTAIRVVPARLEPAEAVALIRTGRTAAALLHHA